MFDPSANDNDAIQQAAAHGHLAVVERLLQDVRVDPSGDDNYAVRWAAENGHPAVDRLLDDDRVDVTVAIQCSLPEDRKRLECRERLTDICIALQAMALPAWITIKILKAARPCPWCGRHCLCSARSSTFTINALSRSETDKKR
jgi:hypothetical protein